MRYLTENPCTSAQGLSWNYNVRHLFFCFSCFIEMYRRIVIRNKSARHRCIWDGYVRKECMHCRCGFAWDEAVRQLLLDAFQSRYRRCLNPHVLEWIPRLLVHQRLPMHNSQRNRRLWVLVRRIQWAVDIAQRSRARRSAHGSNARSIALPDKCRAACRHREWRKRRLWHSPCWNRDRSCRRQSHSKISRQQEFDRRVTRFAQSIRWSHHLSVFVIVDNRSYSFISLWD